MPQPSQRASQPLPSSQLKQRDQELAELRRRLAATEASLGSRDDEVAAAKAEWAREKEAMAREMAKKVMGGEGRECGVGGRARVVTHTHTTHTP